MAVRVCTCIFSLSRCALVNKIYLCSLPGGGGGGGAHDHVLFCKSYFSLKSNKCVVWLSFDIKFLDQFLANRRETGKARSG